MNSPRFNDREYLNHLGKKAITMQHTFESVGITQKIQICNIFQSKYDQLTPENAALMKNILKKTLSEMQKMEWQNFKHLNFAFISLLNVYVEDQSVYEYFFSQFEDISPNLPDFQYTFLLQRVFGLVSKLKNNPSHNIISRLLSKRIRAYMQKPSTGERILQITTHALESQSFPGETEISIICRLAQTLSKQALLASHLSDTTSEKEGLEVHEGIKCVPEVKSPQQEKYLSMYTHSWRNIEEYVMRHHANLTDQSFKFFLQAVVGARVGSQELYGVLLRDFHRRIITKEPTEVHKDLFCMSLRCFYMARTHPLAFEGQYEETFSRYSRAMFSGLLPENKLTLISCYSTIGDSEIVAELSDKLTPREMNALNLRGRILLLWSLCNMGVFREALFKDFLLRECDASDVFYGANVQQLVQVTQILYVIKHGQELFWQRHSDALEEKLKGFSELTNLYHTKNIQSMSEYKFKKIGSFDFADLLNSFGLDFQFEAIVEKVFNVDFVIKDITSSTLQGVIDRKRAVVSLFTDLQFKEYTSCKKFVEAKDVINKKKDLLIDIDGKHHFVSLQKKRQSSNSKVLLLRKMGYNVLQINFLELEAISKLGQTQTVDYFIALFSKSLAEKAIQNPKSSRVQKNQGI